MNEKQRKVFPQVITFLDQLVEQGASYSIHLTDGKHYSGGKSQFEIDLEEATQQPTTPIKHHTRVHTLKAHENAELKARVQNLTVGGSMSFQALAHVPIEAWYKMVTRRARDAWGVGSYQAQMTGDRRSVILKRIK